MSQPTHTTGVLDIVTQALATAIGIQPGHIDADRPLSAVPDIESIHVLRALADLEETLSILVPDDFLFESATVRELANLIARLMGER
jgi:acyl carrier protein